MPPFLEFCAGLRNAATAAIRRTAPVRVVMGNEAADADSIISSLAYAYLLSHEHAAPATLPWIAVSPADMAMRADTAHLFRQVGVDPASLLFRDDIPLRALHDAGRLQLVLMDHNRLPGEWEDMGECVAEIVDHHDDMGLYPQVHGEKRNIAYDKERCMGVGSTCTLVAERALSMPGVTVDSGLATLLLGVIMLDTVGLDPAAGKATPADEEAARQLRGLVPEVDEQALYRALEGVKFSPEFWRHLTPQQRLANDYKQIRHAAAGVTYGSSAVLMRLQDLLAERDALDCALAAALHDRGLHLHLTVTFTVHPAKSRQLMLSYLAHSPAVAAVRRALEAAPLGLEPLPSAPAAEHGVHVHAYEQRNLKASRKQVIPIVQAALDALAAGEAR